MEQMMESRSQRFAEFRTPQIVIFTLQCFTSEQGTKADLLKSLMEDCVLTLCSYTPLSHRYRHLIAVVRFGASASVIAGPCAVNEIDIDDIECKFEQVYRRPSMRRGLMVARLALEQSIHRVRSDSWTEEADCPQPLVILVTDGLADSEGALEEAHLIKSTKWKGEPVSVIVVGIEPPREAEQLLETIASSPKLFMAAYPDEFMSAYRDEVCRFFARPRGSLWPLDL